MKMRTRTTSERLRAKKIPSRRQRQIQLIDTRSGDVIGTYATVEAAFAGHKQFQQGQSDFVPTVIKEL
jgi:hypothetical protein